MNMGEHTVPVLLITANVGSVFENRDGLEKGWIRETVGVSIGQPGNKRCKKLTRPD